MRLRGVETFIFELGQLFRVLRNVRAKDHGHVRSPVNVGRCRKFDACRALCRTYFFLSRARDYYGKYELFLFLGSFPRFFFSFTI